MTTDKLPTKDTPIGAQVHWFGYLNGPTYQKAVYGTVYAVSPFGYAVLYDDGLMGCYSFDQVVPLEVICV